MTSMVWKFSDVAAAGGASSGRGEKAGPQSSTDRERDASKGERVARHVVGGREGQEAERKEGKMQS